MEIALLLGRIRTAGAMVIGKDTQQNQRRLRWGSRMRLSVNSLTPEEFEGFLARLDADRNHAAKKYELLRHKLLKLFEYRKCAAVEELADETLDRVAKKLQLEEIRDVSVFAHGVALKVYLEIRKDTARFTSIHDTYNNGDWLAAELDVEQQLVEGMANAKNLECLQKCLGKLPGDDQHLILEYYRGEKQARITQRRELAHKRGISIEALRSEINALREKLRNCVSRCLIVTGQR